MALICFPVLVTVVQQSLLSRVESSPMTTDWKELTATASLRTMNEESEGF